jgi:hypothetical protein
MRCIDLSRRGRQPVFPVNGAALDRFEYPVVAMSEPSALTRWLPTMLGGLLAVAVVMAYELGFVPREPAPAPACDPPDTSEPAERRRDPITAGARPRRTDDADDGPTLEDKLALLETQNALLAERNVTGELGYYNLAQAELEAMAHHCDVRSDYPKNLDPQESEDLGLTAAEREAWMRALQKFADEELVLYRSLLAEIEPGTPELETMTLAQVRRQLTKVANRARTGDDDSLQRHVAEERAGLRDAPDDPATLSAWNRYSRLRFNAGDRFAELLVDELGADRVHELRSVFDGWPGARTRQWGCPGEKTD